MTDVDERLRGYVSDVVEGCAPDRITSVARFPAGNRHAVFRVSYRDAAGAPADVVVRVAAGDDAAERIQAEREAAVLDELAGVGAPRLYDFRVRSPWFGTPVMCMQLVDGDDRDLSVAGAGDLERLGAVVASVHEVPIDDLVDRFPGARTLQACVDECVERNAAYVPRLRHPLPQSVRSRVDRAFAFVGASVEEARRPPSFRTLEPLVLLHGDVGPGNILWAPSGPVLIDWEYTRRGDPADEIAYIFGQHGLTASQRRAFWSGYRATTTHPRPEHVLERARWWEPVLLLGSALWWLERWSRRADADAAGSGVVDRSVPKPPAYYLDHARHRLDRFDQAVRGS